MRVSLFLLTLGLLACTHSESEVARYPEAFPPYPTSQGADLRTRSRNVGSRTFAALERHSVVSGGSVDAHFSTEGVLLSCRVRIQDPALSPGSAEERLLRREICIAARAMGAPEPPPKLTYSMVWSPPMVFLEERYEECAPRTSDRPLAEFEKLDRRHRFVARLKE